MAIRPHRGSTLLTALVGLALLLSAGAAAAQGRCTMPQLAGTYAFESHGSATSVLGAAAPRHWSLTSAPFTFVGWLTVEPDGVVIGEGWVVLGRIASGLAPSPFAGKLVDLDGGTCAAVLEWSGSPVPGGPPGAHRERLVFVGNGREYRSVLIQSPSATMAWVGRGQRISNANAPAVIEGGVLSSPVTTCGPHLLAGDVLLQCEAVTNVASATAPASSASIFVLDVNRNGDFSGTVYVKNPTYGEAIAVGTFDVQPGCKVEVQIESSLTGVVKARGMIFDDGRGGFFMMPPVAYQTDGTTPTPWPVYTRCELVTLGR